MITVVICSASETLLTKVKQNILNTVGVPCEILGYDNRELKKGICEVYNRGARDAKHGIICYMHEDVEIKTQGWGKLVVDIFNNNLNLGILGVAGTTYKPWMPSGWGHPGLNEINLQRVNIVQHFKNAEKSVWHLYENPTNESLAKVACVDGVWFCTLKDIVQEKPFNQNLLKGFHGYDIDYSLSVGRNFDIAVTYEVLMEHFSEGSFDEDWLEDVISVHSHHEKFLPVNVEAIPKRYRQKVEKRVFKALVAQYSRFSMPRKHLFMLIRRAKNARLINCFLYLKMYYFVIRSF